VTAAAEDGQTVTVHLPFRAPLPLAELMAFLADRCVPGVEQVEGGTYSRVLRLPGGLGVVWLDGPGAGSASRDGDGDGRVRCRLRLDDRRDLDAAVAGCRRLLDLDADPSAVDVALGRDPVLAPLVAAHPGRRVPGHPDGDELAVRAVLGQQISVAAARTLAGRLAARWGERLARPAGSLIVAFPAAAAVADADLSQVGMPATRRATLRALAGALAAGRIRLAPDADRDEVERSLLALPGIGPWTAAYVRMRALGDPDVFLATDLGVRHALDHLGIEAPSGRAADAAGDRWRPWRSYAVQHLWASLAARPPAVRRRPATSATAPAPGPRRPRPASRPPTPGTDHGDTAMTTGPVLYAVAPSPVGDLLLTGDGRSLTGLYFHPDGTHAPPVDLGWQRQPEAFTAVLDQLDDYFAGRRRAFDLPLAPRGTAFQRRVWDALTAIPYGETTTYGALAATIGRPGSARAVGAANGRNPIAIVVPCHRVIGADRRLTGYAGGLAAKQWLLNVERRAVPVA